MLKFVRQAYDNDRPSAPQNLGAEWVQERPITQFQEGGQYIPRPVPLTPPLNFTGTRTQIGAMLGFHGTSEQKALDIYFNYRIKAGKDDSFWIAEKFEQAAKFADSRGGRKGLIIMLHLLNINDTKNLTKHKTGYWTLKIPGATPDGYYWYSGMKILELFNQNQQLLHQYR